MGAAAARDAVGAWRGGGERRGGAPTQAPPRIESPAAHSPLAAPLQPRPQQLHRPHPVRRQARAADRAGRVSLQAGAAGGGWGEKSPSPGRTAAHAPCGASCRTLACTSCASGVLLSPGPSRRGPASRLCPPPPCPLPLQLPHARQQDRLLRECNQFEPAKGGRCLLCSLECTPIPSALTPPSIDARPLRSPSSLRRRPCRLLSWPGRGAPWGARTRSRSGEPHEGGWGQWGGRRRGSCRRPSPAQSGPAPRPGTRRKTPLTRPHSPLPRILPPPP
jgi:hypothetical protein